MKGRSTHAARTLGLQNVSPDEAIGYLAGLVFPATKQAILRHARGRGAPPIVLNLLGTAADTEYRGLDQVRAELEKIGQGYEGAMRGSRW